ncbi:hypothetical protein M413DRAFT_440631, partial [Hebeloma cylindrosporum]
MPVVLSYARFYLFAEWSALTSTVSFKFQTDEETILRRSINPPRKPCQHNDDSCLVGTKKVETRHKARA